MPTTKHQQAPAQVAKISEQTDEFLDALDGKIGKTQEGTFKGTRTINYGRIKTSDQIQQVGFTGGFEEGRLKTGGLRREYAFDVKAGRLATEAQKKKYGTTLNRMERSASRGPMERAKKRRKVIEDAIDAKVEERLAGREAQEGALGSEMEQPLDTTME